MWSTKPRGNLGYLKIRGYARSVVLPTAKRPRLWEARETPLLQTSAFEAVLWKAARRCLDPDRLSRLF